MAHIVGTSGNDSLVGTSGVDTIEGLAGNDTLVGLAGNDSLLGGLGDDRYVVGAGDVLNDAGGIDTVESNVSWTLTGGFENLTFTGTGTTSGSGNSLNNIITGSDGNNWLRGLEGNDTINAGAGNDTIQMSNGSGTSYGADVINGGDGIDTLDFGGAARTAVFVDLAAGTASGGGTGGAGSATVTNIENANGSAFNDVITGSAAANFLFGFDGNDTLDGGVGNDRLEGGAGSDHYAFSAAVGAANADTITGFASGVDKIVLHGLELGSDGNFTAGDARFASGAVFNSGQDPTDRIIYNTSTGQLWYDADGSGSIAAQLIATLQGAPGLVATDIAAQGSTGGGSTISGTAGNDSLTGTTGDDTILGLGGDDVVNGNTGSDSLNGGDGNDLITGGGEPFAEDGPDIYVGGNGDDTMASAVQFWGSSGPDTLDGGFGNDLYYIDDPADVLTDPGGIDEVIAFDMDWTLGPGFENFHSNSDASEGGFIAIGNDLDNVMSLGFGGGRLEGRGGNDTLSIDSSRQNTLLGGEGNDALFGNGLSMLDGGAGDDTLLDGWVETGGAGADSFLFESLFGGTITDFASGVDRIRLDGRAMTEVGASGTLAAGDARFYAAAGATGGHDADDRLVYDTSSGQLFFDRDGSGSEEAIPIATLHSGSGAAALAATDITIDHGATTATGTAGNDSLVGESGNDLISGLAGNDTLIGLEGHDTLDGGSGVDRMEGGPQDDTYYATSGDVIIEEGPEWQGGRDTVIADVSWTLGQDLEDLQLLEGAAGAIQGTGNSGRNLITGNPGNNVLDGAGGEDDIHGGAGNDTLTGTNSSSLYGDAGDDVLIGGRFEDLTGGDGNDRLEGGQWVHGGAGNDTIVSTSSPSELIGGTGFDTFILGLTPTGDLTNWERIVDFTTGEDELRLDGRAFAQIGPSGDFAAGDERFYAAPGANAGHDATDRLIYDTSTGDLWYDPDGSGAQAALEVATLRDWRFNAPVATLQATDIAVDNGAAPPPPPADGQTINGTTGNDALVGGAGNDTINGNAGADLIQGMSGNDSLIGSTGWDTIQGGDGNDWVHGGGWSDTVTGGAGSDSFVWNDAGTGTRDTVTDFASGTDELLFDNAFFAALGANSAWAAGDGRFWAAAGATAGHDADDRLVYNTSNGNLYYDADGSGAGAAQVVATFQGGVSISAADITVI